MGYPQQELVVGLNMYVSNLILSGASCSDSLCGAATVAKYDYTASAYSQLETGTDWYYIDKTTMMDEIYDTVSLENGIQPTYKFRMLSLYINTKFNFTGDINGFMGLTPMGNTVNNFASIIENFY